MTTTVCCAALTARSNTSLLWTGLGQGIVTLLPELYYVKRPTHGCLLGESEHQRASTTTVQQQWATAPVLALCSSLWSGIRPEHQPCALPVWILYIMYLVHFIKLKKHQL